MDPLSQATMILRNQGEMGVLIALIDGDLLKEAIGFCMSALTELSKGEQNAK